MFVGIDFKGDFLKQKITRQLFPQEQHLPSPVIDRGSIRTWQQGGGLDTFARAKARVKELLAGYKHTALAPEAERDLRGIVGREAKKAGMDELPALP
jgi:trimethylamine:corrinoid methyltransferase-like protein